MITVAIPTLARTEWVLEAVESVLRGSDALDYELLVLDNGCDPDLKGALKARREERVRYIPVPDIGLHNGRHAAARDASGDVIAYLDDDVIVSDGWLPALAEAFTDPSVHLVGGPCHPRYEEDPPAWLESVWVSQADGISWCGPLSLMDAGPEMRDIDPRLVFGANFAIRKETLVRVGGFHPDGVPWGLRRFRGDGETAVSDAVGRLGLRSVYHPVAAVEHRVPPQRQTKAYFERRAFLQGISDSFADFRAEGKPGESIATQVRRRARSVLGPHLRRRENDPSSDLAIAVGASHRAGYDYHRAQVAADPVVRAWVNRADYWDAAIP